MEKMVMEWVANLASVEEEEALLLVPQARELEAEENPLQRQTIEEEKKLEWKLRLARERKRRLEADETMERDLRAAEEQRGKLAAQADLKQQIQILSQNMEVVLWAQQEQLHYLSGHDIALQSMHTSFKDFVRDTMICVDTQLHAAMEGTERFCVGAIEGAKLVAPREEEARPRRERVKVKFLEPYRGKKGEDFGNWEANINSYLHLQHIVIKNPKKDGKLERVIHFLTLLVEDNLPFDMVLGMDRGEAPGATLHLREHECRHPSPSGGVKMARLFHVSGVDNPLAHCCLSAPVFPRLVKKEQLQEQVFVSYGRPIIEPEKEEPIDPLIAKLLEEYADLSKAPSGVVSHPIQHCIQIEPGSKTPKGAIHRMSPEELEELRKQLDELLEKVVDLGVEAGDGGLDCGGYWGPALGPPEDGGMIRREPPLHTRWIDRVADKVKDGTKADTRTKGGKRHKGEKGEKGMEKGTVHVHEPLVLGSDDIDSGNGGKERVSNRFLMKYGENAEFNQYWFSSDTIKVMLRELDDVATSVAFLSTPSIYFSLQNQNLKSKSYIFDLDTKFGRGRNVNFVRYDFNRPTDVPDNLHHSFDCVVIDPPFIAEEVWAKYAETAKLLLIPNGRVILSTIPENAMFLKRMLGVEPQLFRPSIPNLVYQYAFFVNYESPYFSVVNPELPSLET
ncbi:hypothetical protein CBR_g49867 [Chara braunii]|uniref:Uncharacterized protein n=1 Tax=Chara braunii TaxID=69332 RepID=A0A388JPA5_CHABU|nr:hypothetical protein CBR_g49867 [Chara braunii]|eukprot:GBG59603.1 hypothetical protein CBR_g49867 [Chara braunii]